MAYITSHQVYIVLSPIFSTIMTVINIPCMVVFTQRMRLATLSLLILANICACDIFVCIFSNNFYIFNIGTPPFKWNTGPVSCKIFKTVTMMMNTSQILSLAVLCYDRMRRFTQSHLQQWQRRHGIRLLVGIWLLSAALTLPRIFLFDEKKIQKFSIETNKTKVVNYNCKPIDLKSTEYIVATSLLFVFGYALPGICILATLIRTQWYAYKHERMMNTVINGNVTSSAVDITRQLSLTFNLLGLLHVIIWTPFFVMSLLDLELNLLNNRNLMDVNFALRCTLLLVGSGKPIIYIICLPKFRQELWKLTIPSIKHGADKRSYSISTSPSAGRMSTKLSVISRISEESDSAEPFERQPST